MNIEDTQMIFGSSHRAPGEEYNGVISGENRAVSIDDAMMRDEDGRCRRKPPDSNTAGRDTPEAPFINSSERFFGSGHPSAYLEPDPQFSAITDSPRRTEGYRRPGSPPEPERRETMRSMYRGDGSQHQAMSEALQSGNDAWRQQMQAMDASRTWAEICDEYARRSDEHMRSIRALPAEIQLTPLPPLPEISIEPFCHTNPTTSNITQRMQDLMSSFGVIQENMSQSLPDIVERIETACIDSQAAQTEVIQSHAEEIRKRFSELQHTLQNELQQGVTAYQQQAAEKAHNELTIMLEASRGIISNLQHLHEQQEHLHALCVEQDNVIREIRDKCEHQNNVEIHGKLEELDTQARFHHDNACKDRETIATELLAKLTSYIKTIAEYITSEQQKRTQEQICTMNQHKEALTAQIDSGVRHIAQSAIVTSETHILEGQRETTANLATGIQVQLQELTETLTRHTNTETEDVRERLEQLRTHVQSIEENLNSSSEIQTQQLISHINALTAYTSELATTVLGRITDSSTSLQYQISQITQGQLESSPITSTQLVEAVEERVTPHIEQLKSLLYDHTETLNTTLNEHEEHARLSHESRSMASAQKHAETIQNIKETGQEVQAHTERKLAVLEAEQAKGLTALDTSVRNAIAESVDTLTNQHSTLYYKIEEIQQSHSNLETAITSALTAHQQEVVELGRKAYEENRELSSELQREQKEQQASLSAQLSSVETTLLKQLERSQESSQIGSAQLVEAVEEHVTTHIEQLKSLLHDHAETLNTKLNEHEEQAKHSHESRSIASAQQHTETIQNIKETGQEVQAHTEQKLAILEAEQAKGLAALDASVRKGITESVDTLTDQHNTLYDKIEEIQQSHSKLETAITSVITTHQQEVIELGRKTYEENRELSSELQREQKEQQASLSAQLSTAETRLLKQLESNDAIHKQTRDNHSMLIQIQQSIETLTTLCTGAAPPPKPPGRDPNDTDDLTPMDAPPKSVRVSKKQKTNIHVNNVHIDVQIQGKEPKEDNSGGHKRERKHHEEEDHPEEEDPHPEPPPLYGDSQQEDYKKWIFTALTQHKDAHTKRDLETLKRGNYTVVKPPGLNLFSNILDILTVVPAERWPPFDDKTCPICHSAYQYPCEKDEHMARDHKHEPRDFMLYALCQLFDDRIHTYNGADGRRKEIIYPNQCHAINCEYTAENLRDVLRHRQNAHYGWSSRTQRLGPFWARLKEEARLTTDVDDMPSAVELLGYHITYRCNRCYHEEKSLEKLEAHHKRFHTGREFEYEERSNDYILEQHVLLAEQFQIHNPGEHIDQTEQYVEQYTRLRKLGWIREQAEKDTESDPETVYIQALKMPDYKTCARALLDIRQWRIEHPDATPAPTSTMTSSIITLLLQCAPQHLPHVDSRKECHICHIVYSKTDDLQQHMQQEHSRELDLVPMKRFIEHITGKGIVSMKIDALRQLDMEETYPMCCPTPGCAFRTHSKELLENHLMRMTDSNHALTSELIKTLGDFWGPIKAHVDITKRIPTLRDLLGYTSDAHKLCNHCHKIIHRNQIKAHMELHGISAIDAPTHVTTVKYWTEFADEQTEACTRSEEWKKLLWSGTRAEIEERTEYMYRMAMQETDEDREELRLSEMEVIRLADERWRLEVQANETREFPLSIDPEAIVTPHQHIHQNSGHTRRRIEPEIIAEPFTDLDILGIEHHVLVEYLTSDVNFNALKAKLDDELKPTDDTTNLQLNVIEQFNRYQRDALRRGYTCHCCEHTAMNESALFTHLSTAHNIARSDWFLIVLEEFIGCTCEMQITQEGDPTHYQVSCCWHPKCSFVQADKHGMKIHIKGAHPEYYEDIQEYGIILATLRAHLKVNSHVTWQQILADRTCMICECGGIFSDQHSVNKHYAHAHNKDTIGNWEAHVHAGRIHIELQENALRLASNVHIPAQNLNRVYQQRILPSVPIHPPANQDNTEPHAPIHDQGIEPTSPPSEAHSTTRPPQQTVPNPPIREPQVPQPTPALTERRRANIPPNPALQPRPIVPRAPAPTQEDKEVVYWLKRRDELRKFTDNGVNMIGIKPRHVNQVRHGLAALFKEELIPLIKADDSWDIYEGRYMETLHRMRIHIATKQGRDPLKIYTYRVPNKDIDDMVLRALQHQKTETKLYKVLRCIDKLIRDTENPEESLRKRAKYLQKIQSMLTQIYPDKVDEILAELHGDADHRQRALDWIRDMIIQVSTDKRACTNTRTTAKMIQDSYHEDPGATFRRYVNPTTSPSCEIPLKDIEDYYAHVWAQETEAPPLVASEDVPKVLETDFSDDIIKFITCEENIKKVVQTRNKMSALGPDGVGYRIYQLGGPSAILYLKELFTRVLKHKKVPQDWLEARTVLLHKKGRVDELNNWRPISITCCTYRIFTALLSRALQTLNNTEKFFSSNQKGFIQKCNGCTEHSILLNELMAHMRRTGRDILATTIDCTNAFGSVPHALIFEVMNTMNIPSIVQDIVRQLYTNATTKIQTKHGTTDKISWRRGVKQGCPLSPLLFNMCLEPLLHALKTKNRNDGVVIGEERIQVQAYADDVVLLAQTTQGMQQLIKTTEEFMKWSLMTINPAKCTCSSYVLNESRRRCSIASMKINNQNIKCLTLGDSCRYLGSPLAATARVRMQANEVHITETETLLAKVASSDLTTNQKLHAIKTFVIPHLDFRFLNTDLSKHHIASLNKRINGRINEILKLNKLPITTIHTSWRDGGLSIPSLNDRQDVLCVRAFYQMYESHDEQVRKLFKTMIDSEKKARKVTSENPGEFLDWDKHHDGERKGNRCLIARTRKVAETRHIQIKDIDDKLQISVDGKVYIEKSDTKVSLGRFLTSHIRKHYIEERANTPASCDRLAEAINNPESNYMLHGTKPYGSGLVRFIIAARHNLLPTPAKVEQWYGNQQKPCTCNEVDPPKQTLSHLLNGCGFTRADIIKRHDKVVDLIRELIAKTTREAKLLADNSHVENTNRTEKPDLVVQLPNKIHIIDVTCPYGGTSNNQRACEKAYNEKLAKYEDLRQFLQERHHVETQISPVIITSLGIAYRKSIKEFARKLQIAEKEIKAFTKRAVAATIRGSFEIWQKFVRQRKAEDEETLNEDEHARLTDDEENIEEDHYEEEPLPLDDAVAQEYNEVILPEDFNEDFEDFEETVDLPPEIDALFNERLTTPASDEAAPSVTSPQEEAFSD